MKVSLRSNRGQKEATYNPIHWQVEVDDLTLCGAYAGIVDGSPPHIVILVDGMTVDYAGSYFGKYNNLTLIRNH